MTNTITAPTGAGDVDYQKGYTPINDLATFLDSYGACTQLVYDKATKLMQAVNAVFLDVDVPSWTVPSLPDGLINRNAYIWCRHLMQGVQTAVNAVVACCNYHSLIDPYTGGKNAPVQLWVPNSLALNDVFLQKINTDFKSANDTLDRLFDWIQLYM